MKAILFLLPLLLTVVTYSTWICIFTSTEDMFNDACRHQADTYRAVQLLICSDFSKGHIFYMSPKKNILAKTCFDKCLTDVFSKYGWIIRIFLLLFNRSIYC